MEDKREIPKILLRDISDVRKLKDLIQEIQTSQAFRIIDRIAISITPLNINMSDDDIDSIRQSIQCVRKNGDQYKFVLKDRYFVSDEKEVESSEQIFSTKDLVDCIHNLMGCFDTPIARRMFNGEIVNESREMGRQILKKYGRSVL